VGLLAATGGVLACSAKRVQDEGDGRKIPLMGVLGAFVFAAQMINFTLPGTGSSGHIGGGLLLDEPSSNLVPKSRRQLIQQLGDLQNARVLASHDLEMVLDLCTRVLVLNRGLLMAEGEPAQILADTELMESCSLEVPHSLRRHRSDHHDTPLSQRDP
jgi:ABC-type cobalamin transport system ATPase subunit